MLRIEIARENADRAARMRIESAEAYVTITSATPPLNGFAAIPD